MLCFIDYLVHVSFSIFVFILYSSSLFMIISCCTRLVVFSASLSFYLFHYSHIPRFCCALFTPSFILTRIMIPVPSTVALLILLFPHLPHRILSCH